MPVSVLTAYIRVAYGLHAIQSLQTWPVHECNSCHRVRTLAIGADVPSIKNKTRIVSADDCDAAGLLPPPQLWPNAIMIPPPGLSARPQQQPPLCGTPPAANAIDGHNTCSQTTSACIGISPMDPSVQGAPACRGCGSEVSGFRVQSGLCKTVHWIKRPNTRGWPIQCAKNMQYVRLISLLEIPLDLHTSTHDFKLYIQAHDPSQIHSHYHTATATTTTNK